MKDKVFFVLVAFIIMSIALPISAQECGDVTGDDAINISDMVRLIDWIIGYGPAPQNPEMGDMDDYQGVTHADIVYLSWYLFTYVSPGPMDCTPTGDYSYASSPYDTLFVPRLLNVPDDQDVIYLPILTNLREDTKGISFYLLHDGPGFDETFDLTWIDVPREVNDGFGQIHGDTIQAGIWEQYELQDISGFRQAAMLTFERVNPGIGDIELIPTDRTSQWRIGVVKDNYDIQIPTVITVDFTNNILQASPLSLEFESVFGFPPPDVAYNINLTDISGPIVWTAETDQTWLQINQNYGMTPSSIEVSIDPTGLSYGVYDGTITITDISFQYSTPIDIPVTLTVKAPFPSMDANCDGSFNISDLTYIVAYLFGIPHGPAPCDPCTGTFPEQ